eukprot:NODE_7369_length_281_cov_807.193966_g6209_i0.p1 GENE.NODE_7369_length_281_cov_807.193966_g6209_i0~~NODE_7369_length_281_cov_807.193966_g6209_i0.p1  ORF type:complete len:66 (+),score=13.56 NODE_7369_length_281_cov_807.193966_g6209_i0:28-225(+)
MGGKAEDDKPDMSMYWYAGDLLAHNRFSQVAAELPHTLDFMDMVGYELMVKADEMWDTLPPKITP